MAFVALRHLLMLKNQASNFSDISWRGKTMFGSSLPAVVCRRTHGRRIPKGQSLYHRNIDKRRRIPKGQSQIDSPEKLAA
jgi:hypothetical protein